MGESRKLSDLSEQDFAVLVSSALQQREEHQTEIIERKMDEKIEAFRADYSEEFDFVAWQRQRAEKRAKLWVKAQQTAVGFVVVTLCSGILWALQKVGRIALSQAGIDLGAGQ